MPLQGLCSFPGVRQVLAANMTFGHGIAPSVATIYIAPQDNFVPQIGPLTFSYGSTTITFQDCKVDRFSFDRGYNGLRRWAIHLFDRRWRWSPKVGGGTISGYYNTRRGDNEVIDETREDVRSLAGLLLDAMGETRYDVSELPEDLFPLVEWDYAHPPEELARLCESMGCRVVLGLDNNVRIVKLGRGYDLSESQDLLEDSLTIDIPEVPDELVCVAAKNRYQQDFELEAVAVEADGTIAPLLELSYNPEKGKSIQKLATDLPNFLNVDPKKRELAKSSVLRWYRIKEPFALPGVKESKLTRDRILPIEHEQVNRFTSNEVEHNRPAWVFGIFYHQRDDMKNNVEQVYPKKIAEGSPAFCSLPFRIDRERGIVEFSEPIYMLENKTQTLTFGTVKVNSILPAKLYLRTAVSLREKKTRAWLHRTKNRQAGTRFGTQPRYILKNETCLNVGGDGKDNADEVDEILDFYLDAAEAEYQFGEPRSITYAGLKAIDLDGAIRQVTYMLGENGTLRTRASRNREEVDVDVSYAERRLGQRIIASIRDAERRHAATPADRAKKGPPE